MGLRDERLKYPVRFCSFSYIFTCKPVKADKGSFTNRSKWMRNIRDDVELCELALPGTHNSGTFTNGSLEFFADKWKTQILNFKEQLNYGIRVFDIRIKQSNNRFELYHDIVDLKLYFEDFLKEVVSFLKSHNLETVLFRLKEENDKKDSALTETLKSYLRPYRQDYFYLPNSPNKNPTILLGEVRGKFIILADNSAFYDYGLHYFSKSVFKIQDNYDLSEKKAMFQKGAI